ncbi:hypothetical protein Emtol_2994 [Emticicia oligotrophica DSM 17448]|uniref:DUF4935 domain-containing protein n=1 Tax=Emticicia oligotrophica (strain DSM 17448 / CIP 109782 / MTCC 6937 / GPTSA100-15) TaxID=929562 RepID=A0ABM5N3Y9_EMTOG|nr:hypothetical protein [Emticicia oligotrophica]AFK04127.1 hypothetical protein Emtol_2994 [Emticicia oligotrophica DSM 17448]
MEYIFDACTVINLLHIDEDEFLLKKISNLNFKICTKVFEEINKNIFVKFKNIQPYPKDRVDSISSKLICIREKIYTKEDYLDLNDSVLEVLKYTKKNGEYYSILLGYYLNTFEKAHILFYTDDSPAKFFFTPHLSQNQIGYIQDSVDLLIFLYRQNQDFTSNHLKKYLSSLYSEYATEYTLLEKEMNNFEVPKGQIKNKDFKLKLGQIKYAINEFKLEGIYELYKDVISDSKKYGILRDILLKHSSFFESRIHSDYFNKIKTSIALVDSKSYFKYFHN